MKRMIMAGLAVSCATVSLAAQIHGSPMGLRVGAAAVELHATNDMVVAGGIGPGHAEGQDGSLRAVATVVQGPLNSTRVAIVALDLLAIRRDYLDAAAMQIERETGIPFTNIVISSTHTHHAPATITFHGYDAIPVFAEQVQGAVVTAVIRANRQLADAPSARAFFTMGTEATIGQNSRIEMRDGTISWIRFPKSDQLRPTGPFDPDFPVLAFKRPDGSLSAVIFGHSTHPIGTRNWQRRSPSFYGLAAQDFEGETGSVTTFIQGASGSTHLLQLNDVREPQISTAAERRILNALRFHVDQATELPVYRVDSLKREVTVAVRYFQEEEESRAVRDYCEKANCDEMFSPYRATEILAKERAGFASHRGEKRKTWVSATRIGDVAIVGVPAELFTQLGIDIKRRSPFRHTIIAELANDSVGYVGNADAYRLGGYQLWMGQHSWTERGTGEFFVEQVVELLHELYSK